MSVAKYGQAADDIATKYGIPTPIFRSLINTESGWNAYAVGKSGDLGLMQLSPTIYKSAQYKAQPFDPISSMNSGAAFLSDLYKQYGNWGDALAHYNAGFNLNNGRGYAAKVLGGAGILNAGDIKNVITNESFTPTIDKSVAGSNQGGDELILADRTVLQGKLDEISQWFVEKFKNGGIKIIVIFIIVISLWFAFKKLAGVK